MRQFTGLLFVAFVSASASLAQAQVDISLRALDVMGIPVDGPVDVGSQLTVEVRLSAPGVDPVSNLLEFELDFTQTSPTIELIAFEWQLDTVAYPFQANTLPTPAAATVFLQTGPGLLSLGNSSELIGRLTVGVQDTGVIDALGGANSATTFQAGFDMPQTFSAENGRVTGGRLEIAVGDRPPNPRDSDGDGVSDDEDAFPNDPAETTDTDGDGVGNNADAFPTDPAETMDTDLDGIGNNADPDDDNDGVPDELDAFPLDPSRSDGGDNANDNGGSGSDGGGAPVLPVLCAPGMLGTFLMLSLSLGLWYGALPYGLKRR